MSTANLDVFCGGTFVFEVAGARFTVYKELIARHSKSFEAMMENGMKGSQEGCEALEDTEELTFGRFLEFVFTGDYNPAEPIKCPPSPPHLESPANGDEDVLQSVAEEVVHGAAYENFEPPLPEADYDWGLDPSAVSPNSMREEWGMSTKKKKGKKRRHDIPRETNEVKETKKYNLEFDVHLHNPLPTKSMLACDNDWSLDYLPVFLSHAQLYVFADIYGVPDLQNLAAARLHEILTRFQYSSESCTNVVELVQYAYSHTPDRPEEVDKLRTIVAAFCANNIGALRTSEGFLSALADGGPFVQDLVNLMCDVFGGI